jgi:hypothetical protein
LVGSGDDTRQFNCHVEGSNQNALIEDSDRSRVQIVTATGVECHGCNAMSTLGSQAPADDREELEVRGHASLSERDHLVTAPVHANVVDESHVVGLGDRVNALPPGCIQLLLMDKPDGDAEVCRFLGSDYDVAGVREDDLLKGNDERCIEGSRVRDHEGMSGSLGSQECARSVVQTSTALLAEDSADAISLTIHDMSALTPRTGHSASSSLSDILVTPDINALCGLAQVVSHFQISERMTSPL